MNNITRPQQTQRMSQYVEDYVHETQRLMEVSSDIVACLFHLCEASCAPGDH